jgi:hypothetical protein
MKSIPVDLVVSFFVVVLAGIEKSVACFLVVEGALEEATFEVVPLLDTGLKLATLVVVVLAGAATVLAVVFEELVFGVVIFALALAIV